MNFWADNDVVIVIITTEGRGCVRTREYLLKQNQ